MKIAPNTVAAIEYTLTNAAGEVLDSSKGLPPLEYLHGAENIVPGLERELEGLQAGDTKRVAVAAKDAYGELDPELVVSVPRTHFAEEDAVAAGMKFHAQMSDGVRVVRVIEVKADTVTLDGNHELAGVDLFFDVAVVSVREAKKEELRHGHPHHAGGCCGGHGHDDDEGHGHGHHHHHDDDHECGCGHHH
jgi:FKBP-type peptidyl-prolyl cis-trans isomerase SlyD